MLRPASIVRGFGQHIRRRMVAGLLILLPIGFTYLVISFLFNLIDPPISNLISNLTGRDIPAVGLATFLVVVYLAGLVGNYVIGRKVIKFAHGLVDLVPVVRNIYNMALRTANSLGASDWQKRYSRVVILDYPKRGVKSIGFVTASYRDSDSNRMVAVYIPTTPIPTSGFLALLPESQVINTNLSVDEAMGIVISGGVLMPKRVGEILNEQEAAGPQPPGGESPPGRASNQ